MEEQSWKPSSACQYLTVSLLAVSLVLSTVSLIFGLLSWIRVEKWRQFHNYVFLQLIAVSIVFITAYFCVRIIYRHAYNYVAELFLETCFNIMLHWQLVTTVMFYLEIVKVITVNISSGYVFANLFAWLLPVFEVILDLLFQKIELHFMEWTALTITVVSTVLYVSVVYISIKNARALASSKVEVLRHILVSTFAYLTGSITLLVPLLTVLTREGLSSFTLSEEDIVVAYLLNIIAVTVFFLSMKNHRELWAEYRCYHKSSMNDVSIE